MGNSRIALLPECWPETDRVAWVADLTDADPLDEPGLAARWRPNTGHTVHTRYGMWLAFLRDTGQLDPAAPPTARVTRERLAAYLEHLRARQLSPVTIAGRLRDLREALRVMQPGAALEPLDRMVLALDAQAEPVRDKRLGLVPPTLLLNAALQQMDCLDDAHHADPKSRRVAENYRVALMIAVLATRPLRLSNIARMEIARHLTREGDLFWCRFGASEMKSPRPLAFPMPPVLTSRIERYLTVYRPMLLRGTDDPHVWISIRATPMRDNSVYYRIRDTTDLLVGERLTPHRFRDSAATFIAEEQPEHVQIIAALLGHATLRTSERHYNQAGMLSAHRRYLEA
nr:site-specific integrase [Rhodospirillales bacterium]